MVGAESGPGFAYARCIQRPTSYLAGRALSFYAKILGLGFSLSKLALKLRPFKLPQHDGATAGDDRHQ